LFFIQEINHLYYTAGYEAESIFDPYLNKK
jgi:hypothetical protein